MGETERSLYQEVLDDPDNLEPRMRYADFIRESNPDRARFIELQIEKFKLRREAGEINIDRWLTTCREARKLLEDNEKEWAKDVANQVEVLLFFRGFIEYSKLDAKQFLAIGRRLYALAPIRYLDLTGVKPVIDQLFSSELLRQTVGLYIADQDLGDDGMKRLTDCPHLGKVAMLEIDGNNIGQPGLDALAASANLPSLEYVNFHNNLVPDPTDTYAVEPIAGYNTDPQPSEGGQKLERKFGYQKWLHGPQLFLERFPLAPGDY